MSDGANHVFPVSIKGVVWHDGDVLLAKNERDEWELPGGKLELHEAPEDCLVRELTEEAGITVRPVQLLDTWHYHIRDGVDVFIVTYGCFADSLAGAVVSEEHSALDTFPVKKISELNMPQGYKDSIVRWDKVQQIA
jgi:8-oxo-dGTP pyrophosphatase MutT (NUDIX family)